MRKIFIYMALALLMMFTLYPFLWLLSSSFKPEQEIFTAMPQLIPQSLTLENYKWALSKEGLNLIPLFINSIIISVSTSLFTAFFAVTGGYVLGRFKFPGSKAISATILLSQMFQGSLIIIPWYKMTSLLGIFNTKLALVLIYSTATIPIGVWLMSGFFASIPKELEEAAEVDGCNKFQSFYKVILPLAKSGIISVIIYSFILSWNDYQYALMLTNSIQSKTIQIGISEIIGSMGKQNWGGIMAGGVLTTLPVVILFSIIQKYIIEGLTAGSVKG